MTAPTVQTCPAWCVTCDADVDGTRYHRGADVPLVGAVTVRAYAAQDVGQSCEEPVFTVLAGEDQELTHDQVQALADRLREFAWRF